MPKKTDETVESEPKVDHSYKQYSHLEFPRHVHKPNRESKVVHTPYECADAIAEGFTVECPPFPDSALAQAKP